MNFFLIRRIHTDYVCLRKIINKNVLLTKDLFSQTLKEYAILRMGRTTEEWQQETNVCHGTFPQ